MAPLPPLTEDYVRPRILVSQDQDSYGVRPSANYDIRGRPFSSIDDGTVSGPGGFGAPPAGLRPVDPRVLTLNS